MLEFLTSFLWTCVLAFLGKRTGFLDHPSFRKTHRRAVPPVGGIAIFLTLLMFEKDNPIFPYSVPMFILGLLDDLFDLSYRLKLIVTVLVSLWFVASTSTDTFIFGLKVHSTFLLIWFVGMMNAFNVIDGLDGLLGGISIVSSFLIGEEGLAFSLLGFLPMNLPPARVFLGNSGAFFLGAFLSMSTVRFFRGDMGFATLFLGLPFYEIVFSFLRRVISGRNPFSADEFHTHHVFSRGLGKWHALIVLVAFSSFFNLLGLTEKFHVFFLFLIACGVLFLSYGMFQGSDRNFNL
ncbi:glycosyltransferase family 4 protein [Thermotoga sp.]|uniref:glycosyltransferase family 4 protein n=1 Tax=Thermotoga sp. TaxID=28240 RepID=UPI0025E62905|nr:MraY family glycosyltransferase [Thermotoga sp.]MCD6551212.1 undecaprenyl/decaprenyl-phosphate alpha-N-acetylglucosaminyl 1-phosphate transferase [Thermotoga sp.]